MPKLNAPTSLVSGRNQVLNGVTYTIGQAIPLNVAGFFKNLSALLSSRRIISTPDPWSRDVNKKLPTPHYYPPEIVRGMQG